MATIKKAKKTASPLRKSHDHVRRATRMPSKQARKEVQNLLGINEPAEVQSNPTIHVQKGIPDHQLEQAVTAVMDRIKPYLAAPKIAPDEPVPQAINRCAVEPSPMAQLEAAFTDALIVTDSLVSLLQERLAPVLRERDGKSIDTIRSGTGIPLIDGFNVRLNTINYFNDELRSLIERIAL